jgi:hypothetical protein
MIGLIAGIGLLFTYLSAAWTVDTSEDSLLSAGIGGAFAVFGVLTIIGIVLFPRTVGLALSPMFMATPVAFVISLFRNSFAYSLSILALGLIAGLGQFLIARLRPSSAY